MTVHHQAYFNEAFLSNIRHKCGLVVTGGDSRFEGCEFESQHHILYGNFTLINCKICFKKTENKPKRDREWPI